MEREGLEPSTRRYESGRSKVIISNFNHLPRNVRCDWHREAQLSSTVPGRPDELAAARARVTSSRPESGAWRINVEVSPAFDVGVLIR